MEETSTTIDRWWTSWRGHPFESPKDANSISSYVTTLFDGIPSMDDATRQLETPEIIEDIIEFAVTHYLREIGARCYSSNSHLPAVLSMASLSERFVPALFEHNLQRLYRPFSSLQDEDDDEYSPKFSVHLASMMIHMDQMRDDSKSYLAEIGRAFGKRKRVFSMDVTERIFIPSEADIDAVFSRAVNTFEMDTPSDYCPVGYPLLLFSIAQGFSVVPGLSSKMKAYYSGRRLHSKRGSNAGFRRPVGSLMKESGSMTIARAITPYLFAACCTLLVYVGNAFGNIQVDIGKRTDIPSSIVLPRSSEYAQQLLENIGKAEITIPLEDTLLFHVGALSVDFNSTKKSILSSFTNLAYTWIALPGDTGRDVSSSLSTLRKKTSITANTVENLQYRKERFFSVLFAMTHALMPTKKKIKHEQELLYENIFQHVLLSMEPEKHDGVIGNFMGENAFDRLASLKYAKMLYPEPLNNAEIAHANAFLIIPSTLPELDVIIADRKAASKRGEALKRLLLLRNEERIMMKEAMSSALKSRPNIPPIVLSMNEGEGTVEHQRTIRGRKGVPGMVEEGGEEEEGERIVSEYSGGTNEISKILMNFPASTEAARSARRWATPLSLSPKMTKSLRKFSEVFPFKYTFSLDEVLLLTSTGIVIPEKDRPPQIPDKPEEILKLPKRKPGELDRILITIFGIERDQVVEWIQDGTVDLSNNEQMAEIEELARVVEESRRKANECSSELRKEQDQVASLEDRIHTLQVSLNEANQNTNKSALEVEALQAQLNKRTNDLQNSERKVTELTKHLASLREEAEELRARGEEIPVDLSNQLEEYKVYLELAEKDRDTARENEKRLFILLAVLEKMATTERNNSLNALIRIGGRGGLYDMYRYSEAFGINPEKITEHISSVDFVLDDAARDVFDQVDRLRPRYLLPEDKVNNLKAQLKKKTRIGQAEERPVSRATVVKSKATLVPLSPIKILTRVSILQKEKEKEEKEKEKEEKENEKEENIPEDAEKKSPELVHSARTLAQVMEKADSKAGFTVIPVGKGSSAPKRSVKRIQLVEDNTILPSQKVFESICGHGFCESVLSMEVTPDHNGSSILGDNSLSRKYKMVDLMDARLKVFSGSNIEEVPVVVSEIPETQVSSSVVEEQVQNLESKREEIKEKVISEDSTPGAMPTNKTDSLFREFVPATSKPEENLFPGETTVYYIDDYRDQEEQEKAMSASDYMKEIPDGEDSSTWCVGAEYTDEISDTTLNSDGFTEYRGVPFTKEEEDGSGGYEGYFYYEVPVDAGEEDGYYYSEEYIPEECDGDSIWPTQLSTVQASDTARRQIMHYGKTNRNTSRLFETFCSNRIYARPFDELISRERKSTKRIHCAPQTSEFRKQARSAITMLVAGILTIASTRIYLQKFSPISNKHRHNDSRSRRRGGRKNYAKTHEDNALNLEQMTIPKNFDDSCRRANKESDTIPMAEEMILKEWKKLLELNACRSSDQLILSPKSKHGELLPLVRILSQAIEVGHGKNAKKTMDKLCDLASFSENVKVTMINLLGEMHAATSRFRCTTNRNEMMDCVRRSNAIKI